MSDISKWAFGMAPFKKETHSQTLAAIEVMERFLKNEDSPSDAVLVSIGKVKGMFNRIIRQDQWDWMTTAAYMNFPSRKESRNTVATLNDLKTKIQMENSITTLICKERLIQFGIEQRFKYYRTYNPSLGRPGQYIYILSRREDRDVLKIGMTTRDVLIRAREINSATGVLFPLGVRNVFSVTDAAASEKVIHSSLAVYRIRADREFFKIPFKDACEQIEKCLMDRKLLI